MRNIAKTILKSWWEAWKPSQPDLRVLSLEPFRDRSGDPSAYLYLLHTKVAIRLNVTIIGTRLEWRLIVSESGSTKPSPSKDFAVGSIHLATPGSMDTLALTLNEQLLQAPAPMRHTCYRVMKWTPVDDGYIVCLDPMPRVASTYPYTKSQIVCVGRGLFSVQLWLFEGKIWTKTIRSPTLECPKAIRWKLRPYTKKIKTDVRVQ